MTPPMTPREKVEQAVKDAIREDAGVGLQMTLTPRFVRGLVDRVLSATSVVDHEAGLASDKPTALASGSGDHAELERLAEAATPGPWSYRDMTPNTYGPAFVDSAEVQSLAICGEAVGLSETHGFCLQVDSEVRMANAAFIAAANPATVKNLLSEIAALRGEVETLTTSGIIEVAVRNPSVADYVQHWEGRATQAERQRDELRRALERIADEAPYRSGYCQSDVEYGPALSADEMQAVARQALANQGADQ